MTEVQTPPAGFTTITYVTKDGEKCTAEKKDGIVTVHGDKNGTRQVPLNDFVKELIETLPKVDLEKTPKKDTVSFNGKNSDDKKLRNKFLAIGGSALAITGAAFALFFVGKGRWWMKAVQNGERRGQEIINGAEQNLRREADSVLNKPENIAPEKPMQERTPIIPKKKKFYVPIEGIGNMPKNLETDIDKIAAMGEKFDMGFRVDIKNSEENIVRFYNIGTDANNKKIITYVKDFSADNLTAPYREIYFNTKTGEPARLVNYTDERMIATDITKENLVPIKVESENIQETAAEVFKPAIIEKLGKNDTVGQVIDDIIIKGNQAGIENVQKAEAARSIIPQIDMKPALPAPKPAETKTNTKKPEIKPYDEYEDIKFDENGRTISHMNFSYRKNILGRHIGGFDADRLSM